MVAVGIDLGTTYSAVARTDDSGRAAVIPNDRGKPITPSVICFKDGQVVVGEGAKELQALGHPTAAFFKRQMGRPDWVFEAEGREYSAVDLSAILLAKLKRDAEAASGAKIDAAIVTVPAYFKNAEREATIEAAKKAGLDVLQIVNEPTAAAITYGYRVGGKTQTILVYDLGGGTFDVSLLRIEADAIRVLTSLGDHELGGKDWDDRILELLARRFVDEFGVDPLSERDSLSDLLVRAEEAKRRLSSAMSTRISVVHGAHKATYELDRATFESLTGDLMERTTSLTRKVLDDQGLKASEIDGVLLVGGSTRMPMVHDFCKRLSDRPLLAGVNVDEAVALGAALLTAERGGLAPQHGRFALAAPRRTIDVTNHPLGMIAVKEDRSAYTNTIILPKNLELPCVQSRPYQHRLRRNGSGTIEVFITQGESDRPTEVSYLGRHVIHDVPADSSGAAVVDIEYRYDASGTVKVAARSRSSGNALRVTVDVLPDDVPERFAGPPTAEFRPQHLTAYLAFDLSGSMSGSPLAEAKKAAHGFLQRVDLANCSMGIIAFSDRVETGLGASQDARRIERAIDGLTVGRTGSGNDGQPFDELLSHMGQADGPRFGIVLTDGMWSDQPHAIARAKACKAKGIDIIAIGFGSADKRFLNDIASSDEVSFLTNLGGLVETFSNIAQVLTESGGVLAAAPGGRKGLLGMFGRD